MKKKLSKREDFARRWQSFKKHCWLLLQPFSFAVVVSVLWWCELFSKEIHFAKDDENILLAGVIVMLALTYGIVATTTFSTVWDKYQKVVISVLKRDKETFLCYRDERIPIVIHLLILAFAIPLLAIISLLEYKTAVDGFVAVFTVSFALATYAVVIIELQNPSKSLWFIERIPVDWLTIDIDVHFQLAEENGKNHSEQMTHS